MHIYTFLKNRFSFMKNTAKALSLFALLFVIVSHATAEGGPVKGRPVHKRTAAAHKLAAKPHAIPVNDDICGAITLQATAACNAQTFSNTDATASPNTPFPTCENFTDGDVWFKVVVPAGATTLTLNSGGLNGFSDGGAAIYSATGTACTALTLTQVACFGTGGTLGTGDFPLGTITGVSGAQVYYIRFYGFGGETGNFAICVTANIPPGNDNCSAATALTVNPNYACAAITAATTVNATPSPETPQPTCNTTGTNDDVWFTFTATGPQHRIVLSQITGSSTALSTAVYSGTCGALTQIFCGTTNSMDIGGLVANQTYYVRVYTNPAATTSTASFNICVGTAPPPPPNDQCTAATNLTVNADLNCGITTSGTTESATPSTGVPAPTCGTTTGVNDDVWYTFTATGPTHWISLSNIAPAGTAMTFTVYSGTCAGGFTQVACSTTSPAVVTGLTANTVYYVRVYTDAPTVGTSATYNICIGTPPPAPANDNCATATTVPVNPNLNCGNTIPGSTASATPSAGVPAPTCGNTTGVNDDVWFSFTATGTVHWVSLLNISGGNTMTYTIYSGTCGALTQIGCVTGTNVIALTGLTPNSVYYVRVYTDVATPTVFSTFDICVGTPVPPANDDCPNAAPLVVNTNYNCTTTTPGTTSGATQSATLPVPTCSATGINDDVWFTFVATGGGHRVSLNNISPAAATMSFAVYSGTCGAFTQLGCSPGPAIDLVGLVANQTYYVRAWTTATALTTIATFNVCVGTAPPPPANDECATATNLTVNPDVNCTITTPGYTYSATQSTTTPLPTCGTAGGYNDDVWYTFTALNVNQRVSLLNVTGSSTNMTTAVYTGSSCANLTLVQCQPGPINNLYGLTVNQQYWVRVWTDPTGISNAASYDICVSSIPPPSAGTLCSVSSPFCTSSQPAQSSPTGQPSLGQFGCLFTTPNPTWYVLQVATAGNLIIVINQVTPGGTGIDVDYAAWGPFTSVADGCSQIAPTTSTGPPMVSCSYSAAATETVTIPNAQVGEFYILLVTNFNGTAGTITFTPGPGNTGATNCGIVCNATATNSGAACPGGTFNLFGSSTIAGATYTWTGPGGFTSAVQNPTGVVAPATPGSYNYILTVHVGANTCTSTTIVNVSNTPALALTSAAATTNQTVCTGVAITNITYNVTGATGAAVTGLPAGITGTYAGGVFTISGSPTVTGTFNYTVSTTGGCSAATATATGTIIVNTGTTLVLTSAAGTNTQTVCIGSPITNIVYTAGNGATGVTATGLPAGVTGTYAAGVFTISGTPAATGIFNYTVATTGGCGAASLTGTITVNRVTITLTSAAATAAQTVCIGTAITPITYGTGNGTTGVTVSGLPAGTTGVYSGGTNGTFTITGTPTTAGTYTYTVTASGCGTITATGTITVSAFATITLTSAAATAAQTVCINAPITNITYGIGGGGTGASATGLPAGVTGTYATGVFTISGTPSVSGTFNYTVTTSGGCGSSTATGTITVSVASTISLTSAAATANQTVCINAPITNIVYTTANGATGATATGLPLGVTGTYAAGVFTISGTPTVSGSFPYTVSTTGGCGTATLSGTITVSPLAVLTLTSAAATATQTVCLNAPVTNIVYTASAGATGATVTGLPAGVAGTFAAGVFTISGSPSVSGTFNYTVSTTGGCGVATRTGTIIVTPVSTLILTSAAATTAQTICINTAAVNIVYTAGGGFTGATATGLPAGLNGVLAGNVFTISGTATVSGTFNYTVTAAGCGNATRTGTITVNPALIANAGNPVTIVAGSSTQLNGSLSTAGANYLWTANGPLALVAPSTATQLNPVVAPVQTTTYMLSVSDPLGICPTAGPSSVVVTVVTSCINVRNAFTPNGDGINDTWFVYDQSFCLANDGVSVNVFNRYGSKVYENKNYKNKWDGNYKGKPVPDGTYYAIIEFKLANGRTQVVKTDVTVLR